MHLYDFILLSKVHNLSYSELRCTSTTEGFMKFLTLRGYDVNQRSNSNEYISKNTLALSRNNCSNITDS
jgi:hypothetical protein